MISSYLMVDSIVQRLYSKRNMGYWGPYAAVDEYDLTLSHRRLRGPEAVFKEKCGVWDPLLQELTKMTSSYLIVDSEAQRLHSKRHMGYVTLCSRS